MKLSRRKSDLGALVGRFMTEMHRFDAGRTVPILHAAKLTTPQLAALGHARGPKTVSDVAEHLGLSRPATSQMIDKLVRNGLLRRTEGVVDRRETYVVLTAKGDRLLQTIAAARATRFDASLAVLPPPLASRFEAILEEVVEALELGQAEPQTPRGTAKGQRR